MTAIAAAPLKFGSRWELQVVMWYRIFCVDESYWWKIWKIFVNPVSWDKTSLTANSNLQIKLDYDESHNSLGVGGILSNIQLREMAATKKSAAKRLTTEGHKRCLNGKVPRSCSRRFDGRQKWSGCFIRLDSAAKFSSQDECNHHQTSLITVVTDEIW